MTSRNHKTVCTALNYIENFLILASTITGCVFICDFDFLISILIGITSSAIGIKIWGKTAARIKNRRIMFLSKCSVCDSKKSNFMKGQEASGLLSSLGIKTPLSKIPLVGSLLFWMQCHWIVLN